jgi:hypothetical protein
VEGCNDEGGKENRPQGTHLQPKERSVLAWPGSALESYGNVDRPLQPPTVGCASRK